MTSKQRAKLRSLASDLQPIYQIGKGGITPTLVKGLDEALEKRELIKITVLKNCEYTGMELMEELSRQLSCEPVAMIGSKMILYRLSKNDKIEHIQL